MRRQRGAPGVPGQPLDRTLGNGLTESWQYNSPMQQLSVHQVGSLLNRSYTYDAGGNVATITDNHLNPAQTQHFTYDDRDRLRHAVTSGNGANAYDESASYDVLGNFMTKGTTGSPTGYTYNASHPHAPVTGIGGSYGYDANGNRTSGRGDSNITWNADNQLTGLTHSGVAESYTYDGDGGRVKRVAGSTTTYYVGTALEKSVTSGVETNHFLYSFGGTVVAERATTSSTNVLTYLHADHLGSVSLVTSTGGGQLYVQEFSPWGSVRTGGVPASTTTLNYTGQRLDATGLLYYNARYYDPALGRFISADTASPDKAEPQSRNRYSYALNNPLALTDPSGHSPLPRPDGGVGTAPEPSPQNPNERGREGGCAADDPRCAAAADELAELGFAIYLAAWLAFELEWYVHALHDLMNRAGWDVVALRQALGVGDGTSTIRLWRNWRANDQEYFDSGGPVAGHVMSNGLHVFDSMFASGEAFAKRWLVHETAHLIDNAAGNRHRWNMPESPSGYPSRYAAQGGAGEDFAESVAYEVYPGYKDFNIAGGPRIDTARKRYIWNQVFLPGRRYNCRCT